MSAAPFALIPAAYVYLLRPGADDEWETLLQLRQGTGYMDGHWAAGIAGHVEVGESVRAAAVREAVEETGITVHPSDLLPLTAMHRTGDRGGAAREQRVDFFFTLRRWQGEPQVREEAKNAGLRWWPLCALPSPMPPHEHTVLTSLARTLTDGAPMLAILTAGFDDAR